MIEDTGMTCAILGALAFGLVGLLFGGLAGAWTRLSGRAAGGPLGRAVAEAIAPLGEDGAPPAVHGAVAGGVDGALFLGAVGFLVGVVAGLEGLLYVLAGLVALCLAAAVFGRLAYGLVGHGGRSVTAVCAMLVGAAAGATITDGGRYAALAGAVAGLLVAGLIKKPRSGDRWPKEPRADRSREP